MKNLKLLFSSFLLLSSLSMFAQQTIRGKVTEKATGEPLPGVSILIKGTIKGAETDFDGNYVLNDVKPSDVLVFSFIGQKTQEVSVGSKVNISIQLEEGGQILEEVVIVGYGVQKKSRVLGNAVRVNAEDIKDVPVPSVDAALQGKAAGVQVIQGSGLAGSANVVRIRGISSISAGGDPLYVIDGIPITQDYFLAGDSNGQNNNPLAALNQNDIESIEVLKDAAAAGIYGSRGANGVILIKTKRGKKGLKFSFNSSSSFSKPTYTPNIMNNRQLLEIYQEAWENDGHTGLADLPRDISWTDALNTNTNWVDLVTKTGVSSRNAFSVNYGNKKLKAYANLSYDDTESFIVNDEYQRISGRFNIDYNILDNLKVGLNTSLSKGIYKQVNINDTWRNAQSFTLPFYSPYQANGDLDNTFPNPLVELQYRDRRNEEVRTINAISLDYEPIKNLYLRGTVSMDYMDFRTFYWESREVGRINGVVENERNTYASVTPTFINNYNTNLTASYLWDVNDQNSFNFLLGTEYQRSTSQYYKFYDVDSNLGYINSDAPLYKNSEDLVKYREYTGQSTYSFASYFGRVKYTFDNKLDLMALARVDGSSRFGENNRYGFFPTVSAAYDFSKEKFITNNETISRLKLKTSYGITGNSAIGNDSRFGAYSIPNSGTFYLGEQYQSIIRLENPDLKWETAQTFDVGLELNFFDDRIETELSAYYKKSKDVLLDLFQVPSAGYGERLWVNAAEVENKGVEFNLNSKNIVTDNFTWTTNFNIAHNTNKLVSLGGVSPDLLEGGFNDTRVIEGQPIGTNYLVRFSRVDPTDGLPIFLDKEGNETKTFDLANRVSTGSVIPDATGGFGTKFKYKNWGLDADFVFTIGGNIYDGFAKRSLGTFIDGDNSSNVRTDIYDRWRNPGDTSNPRVFWDHTQVDGLSSVWQYNHTGFLYDASYLRMRNISLKYSLPNKFLEGSFLNSLMFTFSGTNLVTWTKYPGGDPEIARDFQYQRDRNLSPNVSYLSVPQAKTFTININATF
ncbi:TonB-linked SusC/RagA family outer membrane protein [Tenacibaculum adriaticum]|uniref:TonB-linked SusC/RagA family outer membrane protein n=1 Tax=Tenacibaculum adriaticum TaxID=413713 RepID=A0A5S5DT25_9FLAO|nr:SusC/RagA family TonB-linked outer membrane protein [Tenacibaculum adriaticum]TYP99041.1 TonB-linked SusC/RagA family outer membrane protein [Tenacibaculum adriaticum]